MASTATATINRSSEGGDLAIRDVPVAGPAGTSAVPSPDLRRETPGQVTLQAIAQRRAARTNAASIKESEVASLLTERQSLLTKKFDGGLDRAEERRLALVRWSLDRIEDARHGGALDELETAVELYERMGRDITHLLGQLQTYAPKGNRR